MTAITTSAPVSMASDASFRAWATVWHNALSALGWVQTADTGQINLATVTKPATANTVAGYEIWRMNDSLQATVPVFIKIEYGIGNATTYAGLWFSLGFSTDGAGNINSTNMFTRQQGYCTLNSATNYDWKFSGAANRLGAWQAATATNGYIYIFVERTHNNDGTDNGTGVMVIFGSQSAYNYSQIVTASGMLPAQTRYTGCLGCVSTGTTASSSASNQYDTNLYLAPMRLCGMGESNPFLGIAGYYTTDLTTGNLTTTQNWDGSSATFYPTGLSPTYMFVLSSMNVAMRFD